MTIALVRDARPVVCLGCGLLCDDVTASLVADAHEWNRFCPRAVTWFERISRPISVEQPTIRGQTTTYSAAYAAAATHLHQARQTLIIGLEGISVAGIRAALALADRAEAIVDVLGPNCHTTRLQLAQPRGGEVTFTLGELTHRADHIVFWRAPITTVAPRFADRFLANQEPWIENERLISSVGFDKHALPKNCRSGVSIDQPPADDLHLIARVRQALRQIDEQPVQNLHELTSDSPDAFADALARQIRSARFTAVVVSAETVPTEVIQALDTLVTEANTHTNAARLTLTEGGNRPGAEAVCCWQTGYPNAIGFRQQQIVHDPVRFHASRLVADKAVDLLLVLGDGHAVVTFLEEHAEPLADLTTIRIAKSFASTVSTALTIPVREEFVETAGIAYRADDVALRVDPTMEPGLTQMQSPTMEHILEEILRHWP